MENNWLGIHGTILNKAISRDHSKELTFEQRAEWMSHMDKKGKNVSGRRICKYNCTKVEDLAIQEIMRPMW